MSHICTFDRLVPGDTKSDIILKTLICFMSEGWRVGQVGLLGTNERQNGGGGLRWPPVGGKLTDRPLHVYFPETLTAVLYGMSLINEERHLLPLLE